MLPMINKNIAAGDLFATPKPHLYKNIVRLLAIFVSKERKNTPNKGKPAATWMTTGPGSTYQRFLFTPAFPHPEGLAQAAVRTPRGSFGLCPAASIRSPRLTFFRFGSQSLPVLLSRHFPFLVIRWFSVSRFRVSVPPSGAFRFLRSLACPQVASS